MTTTRKKRCAARSPEEWAAIVTEWRESPRTAEAIAADHDVSRTSLYGWAARLRASEVVPTVAPTRTASFVGVRVLGARPASVASTEARMELVTTTGRVLRVFGEVDTRTLVQMIKAAEAC